MDYKNKTERWIRRNDMSYIEHELFLNKIEILNIIKFWGIIDIANTESHQWRYNVKNRDNFDITAEHYFCRQWLKKLGKVENEFTLKVLNKKFQHGYWVVSQGLNPDSGLITENLNVKTNKIEYKFVKDPLRLLRASGALVLPTRSNIRFMGCSDDVTHSWAVPGLGIKIDCVPGRLFFFYTNIIREGIYFGQCSELCGWNHYNMPIILYALPLEHFIVWWEIELHPLFNKRVKNNGDKNSKHYKLINFKYK
jgi:heme/copper-type cytochrome/quinol oxidase subunit 2